jgi:sulfur carrier protein ThiS adenylyltransferase
MAPGTKCSDAGVMGPVVGTIGNFQALQAIKYLSKDSTAQFNTLYLFDGQYLEWRPLNITKDPTCSVCGEGDECNS